MRLTSIATTPVKGLGLSHPDRVDVTATGVRADRRYAMVDANRRIVNGKHHGSLVRVRACAWDDPETLILQFPDGTRVGGEVTLGEPLAATRSGATRAARIVEGDYAAALSAIAGEPLRLVRLPDGTGIDRVDEGPVSLLTTGSLEALRRQAGLPEPVDGRRFRMTFTIEHADEHAEDAWIGRRIRIGSTVIAPTGHIGRCVVTTQSPDDGVKDLDTLAILAGYRGALDTTEPDHPRRGLMACVGASGVAWVRRDRSVPNRSSDSCRLRSAWAPDHLPGRPVRR